MTAQTLRKSICKSLILALAFVVFGCGDRVTYDESSSLIGKKIRFSDQVFQVCNLNEKAISEEEIKYGCIIVRKQDLWNFTADMFTDKRKIILQVKPEATFKVVRVFKKEPIGLRSAFAPEVNVLVVKDDTNTYTIPVVYVKSTEWIR